MPSSVAGEVLVLSQEMTIARDDFLRSLAGAVDGAAFIVDGDAIASTAREPGWRIELTQLPDLRLGLLALPRHRVRIFLRDYSAAEATRFLDRFELYFRRAGG
jgi:hypothetical protein